MLDATMPTIAERSDEEFARAYFQTADGSWHEAGVLVTHVDGLSVEDASLPLRIDALKATAVRLET